MRPITLVPAALAVLAIALAASVGAAAEVTSADRGGELVRRNCGMCHAVTRSDASPNPAAPAFRDLHRRYPIDNLAEALAEGILTGHPQMPEFSFAEGEVVDIIAYLKSIQLQRPARADPTPQRQAGAFP
jgi:mono/diheme cytochrome c family protein